MSAVEDIAAPADPGAVQALLARVGARVREARGEKAMSRRVLAEASGVSPRYLAQLEAGEGNISIALLFRVARALDRPLAELVAPAEAQGLDARFQAADAETQAAVLRLLMPQGSIPQGAADLPDRSARRRQVDAGAAGRPGAGGAVRGAQPRDRGP